MRSAVRTGSAAWDEPGSAPSLSRLACLLTAVCAALLLIAPPALAHTRLRSSMPAEGARLATAPTSISLTFAEAVRLPAKPLRVDGPDGASAWTVGPVTTTDATVTAPVTAVGPAGVYTVVWSALADDGDVVKGVVHFTMTAATGPAATTTQADATTSTTASPAPAAAGDDGSTGGASAWGWVIAAAAVAAVVAALVVRRLVGRPPV